MKKTLFSILITLALVAFTPIARATVDLNSVASNATNLVAQAQHAAEQANAALAAVQSLVGKTDTNSVETNKTVVVITNAPSASREAINAAVLDILHGVKESGSEIYSASKSAIIQAVDFTKEQTPLVVVEFLHWKLTESIVFFVVWAIPALILLNIARTFNKKSKSDDVPDFDKYTMDKGNYTALKWGFRIVAMLILMINISTCGMTIAKICVAPRVYLIEYVVNTIQTSQTPSR